MLNKTVNDLLERLSDLEIKVDKHLADGIIVITNIATLQVNVDVIKKAMWVCVGASLTTIGALIVALVMYVLKK